MKPTTPQSPATVHILLALAGEPRHGYGIMQEVLQETGGALKLGPATLYDTLQRLLDQGWVSEVKGPSGADARRKYYKLTAVGAGVLKSELARWENAVRTGKLRLAERRT